jgi:signal transduction histidine kinase
MSESAPKNRVVHQIFVHRTMPVLAAFKKYSFDASRSGLLFLFLTFIAIARSMQHMFVVDVNEPVQYSLWWHVPFNLFMWWNWFLFVPPIHWFIQRLSHEASRLRMWVIICFLLPMGVVIVRQFAAALISTAVLSDKSDFLALFFWRLYINPWVWLDLIVYFAILIALQLVEYQRKSTENASRILQLETQYVRSQLNALRSQLHPHFLFNTLNTVSTLILKEDNPEAERMLTLLNDFLKTTAFDTRDQEITLREELRFISGYLEIERVRFIDKLEVRTEIGDDTLDVKIPGFLLQPIVENAIYHAIALKASHGLIVISANREDGYMTLSVRDNGPGLSLVQKKKSKEGVGLKITKERLAYLYKTDHRFVVENVAGGGVKVSITIPTTPGIGEAVPQ